MTLATVHLFILGAATNVFADPIDDGDITVQVSKNGPIVVVNATLIAPVPARLAWETMTDYDHMAQFLPNLKTSKIVERYPNKVHVKQRGAIPIGPLSISFAYVREVEFYPFTELRSRIISGTVEKADVTTQLFDRGASTYIVYRSEAIPGVWVPLGISTAVIQRNVYQQLFSMRSEMSRRNERQTIEVKAPRPHSGE